MNCASFKAFLSFVVLYLKTNWLSIGLEWMPIDLEDFCYS